MGLTRPLEPMPGFVSDALQSRGLQAAYDARPANQRNDWLRWITQAKREATRQRRLEKMLAELAAGHGYMGMDWQPTPSPATSKDAPA